MAAPALRNTIYSEFSDTEFNEVDEFERDEFFAGERVCPPRPRRRGLTKLVSWLVIVGSIYGAWSLWRDRPAWLETAAADAFALWSALNPKDAQPLQPETAANAPPANPPEQAVTETEIADAPGAEAGTAFETVTTAAVDSEAAPAEGAAVENAQLETADGDAATPAVAAPRAAPPRQDRLEKQAEAVGLNPDLSKSLLKRLTEADFRNAAIAIKTALAETAETAIFTWPAKPKPNLALFEVRFVPGAADNCRRYVVTVTKDRWSTTAPPMEKCGVSTPAASSSKS